ncbi:MAG: coproporphyrinogen dehydrogenase HemZ [Defluviitaleaceae bacterium]|nr:coproporphyrinogen dehydrogenase HemZ [Defluviitaleaceae bacterium]
MINCLLKGHNFVNEVQVSAQIFFQGSKFNFCEIVSETGFNVESIIENGEIGAVIYKDGAEISRYFWQGDKNLPYLNERRIVMLAVYHALKKVVTAFTPWGALTGIRPSKLVREWLDNGYHDNEIIQMLENPFCCANEKARLALEVAHAEKQIERRIFSAQQMGVPIGIYISVPFCPSRCVYCSFNTSDKPASEDFLTNYINAVIAECREKAKLAHEMNTHITSIYIGGGTPTFLPENLLEALLHAACEALYQNTVHPLPEFTVEAGRPDTLSPKKLKILHKYGVNRIAINPQTLNNQTLKEIGRNHSAEDFFTAFKHAREIGFHTINTDLIAGLPNETTDDMHRNMQALADIRPENITIHTLAIKRASRLIEESTETSFEFGNVNDMLSIATNSCADMGLLPYYLYRQKNMVGRFENIGYSLPSHECLYNVGMMAEVQTILGIGAGAVSKFVNGNKITREFNPKNPEIYIARNYALQPLHRFNDDGREQA